MKIGLGTVQFGLNYGISNDAGQTPLEEILGILDLSRKSGIEVLDTASIYGQSETSLGNALGPNTQFKIITKCPPLKVDLVGPAEIQRIETAFHESQVKLKTPIHGLMVHHAPDLLAPGGDRIWAFLQEQKNSGRVKKIGVSVYSGAQIDQLLLKYPIELIQLPLNIFDQRLLHGGQLRKLKEHGVEIHARSIFLQGLMFLAPEKIPDSMRSVREILAKLQADISASGGSIAQAALQFVQALAEVDIVICGVNNRMQLQELVTAASMPPLMLDFSKYALQDESILDPFRWPAKG